MIYLIGAGPGDPELMTLKAARVLGQADVVLVDDLVSPACLAFCSSKARIIRVGKRGGCRIGRPSTPQVFIEQLLIRFSREGKTVARLKGGDPFVFGRGGEELERLRSRGIEVEVIPGVTAGIAVPAALGIPVTHRAMAHGVTFVTGHGADIDWQALVRTGTTLVVYMGLRNLESIVSSLKAAGMNPATPACLIENGTLDTQKQLVTTLAGLSGAGFSGPAIVVIGEVVRLAQLRPPGERGGSLFAKTNPPVRLAAHAPLHRGAAKASA